MKMLDRHVILLQLLFAACCWAAALAPAPTPRPPEPRGKRWLRTASLLAALASAAYIADSYTEDDSKRASLTLLNLACSITVFRHRGQAAWCLAAWLVHRGAMHLMAGGEDALAAFVNPAWAIDSALAVPLDWTRHWPLSTPDAAGLWPPLLTAAPLAAASGSNCLLLVAALSAHHEARSRLMLPLDARTMGATGFLWLAALAAPKVPRRRALTVLWHGMLLLQAFVWALYDGDCEGCLLPGRLQRQRGYALLSFSYVAMSREPILAGLISCSLASLHSLRMIPDALLPFAFFVTAAVVWAGCEVFPA